MPTPRNAKMNPRSPSQNQSPRSFRRGVNCRSCSSFDVTTAALSASVQLCSVSRTASAFAIAASKSSAVALALVQSFKSLWGAGIFARFTAARPRVVGKVTAIVNAQVYRNQTVPMAEASVVKNTNDALSDGAEALARAAGEAWSFRTLESQYRVAPGDYLFRRRLETLENVLAGRRFTIVDARIQRDGGELWLMP